MKHIIMLILVSFLAYQGSNDFETNATDTITTKVSDTLKVLNFEALEAYLATKDDRKTYVINFWATWCAP